LDDSSAAPQHHDFKMLMQNSTDCLNMIVRNLKSQGLIVNKGYEKKRKIMESEVTSEGATKGIVI